MNRILMLLLCAAGVAVVAKVVFAIAEWVQQLAALVHSCGGAK